MKPERFLFKNDGIDAADDAEAWDKACAWYESIRPSGYIPRELVLTKADKEIRKDVIPRFADCGSLALGLS